MQQIELSMFSVCVLNCLQVGEESSVKTFLIDVKWGDLYPNDLPHISLDAFYNKLVYVLFSPVSAGVKVGWH